MIESMRCVSVALTFILVSLAHAQEAAACSFPPESSTAYPMADGEHVFVMQMHDGDLAPYPTSGLYARNAPSTPIWEWQGRYLYNAESKIFSHDGRFMVRAMESESAALQVYDRGKLARAFPLSLFVTDLSAFGRIPMLPCSDVNWYRDLRFDGESSRLVADSIDSRIVTVDVATGEVLERREIEFLSIQADTELVDGTRLQVNEIGTCGTVEIVRVSHRGEPADGPALTGSFHGLKSNGERVYPTGRTLSLHSIRILRRQPDVDLSKHGYILFRIDLEDGSALFLELRDLSASPEYDESLCGRDSAGERTIVRMSEVAAMRFGTR